MPSSAMQEICGWLIIAPGDHTAETDLVKLSTVKYKGVDVLVMLTR